jgi:NADH:ubiquinone oxidoreductase subunit 5 (subunit L)/multisubunit Na+/H+ antiporter MnhA subunit
MFTYKINRVLAVTVGAAALITLLHSHDVPLLEFRAALVLYSSVLITAISYFAEKNLVGQRRYGRFGSLLLLTSLGIYATFLTSNLLVLGLGWSCSGLGAALLVNHPNDHSSQKASRAIASWFLRVLRNM